MSMRLELTDCLTGITISINTIVNKSNNSQCEIYFEHFIFLYQVMECDVDYAFNEAKEECYNIHDNYKKSVSDQVLCKDRLLKSSIYHHTYGGPSNN